MGRRWFCALLTLALLATCFKVAATTQNPKYSAANFETDVTEEEQAEEDEKTLTLWYTDDALSDYLTSAVLSYQKETGIRTNLVLASGLEYLEQINEVSIAEPDEECEDMPDLYITTHDNLMRAHLAGLAANVDDRGEILKSENYPITALNAVTCDDEYVAYPLYYETNFFLYNKTYMADIAQNRIEAESDMIEGIAAQEEADSTTDAQKKAAEAANTTDEGNGNTSDKGNGNDSNEGNGEESEDMQDRTGEDGQSDSEEEEYDDSLSEEDAAVSGEALERLATMIPATLDDITTFANNYEAPDTVESVFEWDVSDIFYNYFFVGNYVQVGGENGDNAGIFNIYNKQAVDCLSVYQSLNQFFSIDAKEVSYDQILDDFISGKTVFTVATTDAISKINSAKSAGDFPYEYGVTVLPDISDLLKARGLSVTTSVAVNGYSEKGAAADALARYIAFDKADDLYIKSGKIACRRNVSYDDPEISNIMTEYEKSVPLPKMIETANYWVQLEIAFMKIWEGEDADEVLKELSDTMGAQIEEIRLKLNTQESVAAGAGNLLW